MSGPPLKDTVVVAMVDMLLSHCVCYASSSPEELEEMLRYVDDIGRQWKKYARTFGGKNGGPRKLSGPRNALDRDLEEYAGYFDHLASLPDKADQLVHLKTIRDFAAYNLNKAWDQLLAMKEALRVVFNQPGHDALKLLDMDWNYKSRSIVREFDQALENDMGALVPYFHEPKNFWPRERALDGLRMFSSRVTASIIYANVESPINQLVLSGRLSAEFPLRANSLAELHRVMARAVVVTLPEEELEGGDFSPLAIRFLLYFSVCAFTGLSKKEADRELESLRSELLRSASYEQSNPLYCHAEWIARERGIEFEQALAPLLTLFETMQPTPSSGTLFWDDYSSLDDVGVAYEGSSDDQTGRHRRQGGYATLVPYRRPVHVDRW